MKRKIITIIVLVLLFLMPFSVVANAVSTAIVYGDDVNTQPNSIFFVPVSIKNNPGIMGFKITVKYDSSILSLPVVTRGTVTERGMLNDSSGVSENGTLDVVWTNDSAVSDDGTLFIISFNCDETEAEITKLSLSYSQQDTFNEAYEDVFFECKEITVSFSDDNGITNAYQGEIKEPDYEDVIVAVDSAIKDMPFDSVKNIDRDFDDEILAEVNETLSIMTGTQNYFGSVDEIIGAYKAATATDFVNTSVEAVDPGVIEDIIDDAVQIVGAETVDTVPQEKKADFVAAVENGLKEQASDVDMISDSLTEDEAIDAIKSLQSVNEENQSAGTKIISAVQKTDNLLFKVIIAAAAAIIVVFVVLAVVIKKKQKKYEEVKSNEENI